MRFLALIIVIVALASCTPASECGSNALCAPPSISVDVCRDPAGATGGVRDCSLTIQAGAEALVSVHNAGDVNLVIAPTLDADPTLISMFTGTTTVLAQSDATLSLVADDAAAGVSATLSIDSNAANIESDELVVIPVNVVDPLE